MELSFRKTKLFLGPIRVLLLTASFFLPTFVHAVPAGWNIFWSDEFNQADNSSPNGVTWGYDTGCTGWGNSELENYTNSNQNSFILSDAAATDGKCLIIDALNTGGGSCGYTSARLLTSGKQSFQYGWIEARIKLPYGQGIWPAFWMLGTNIGSAGWPTCGEIDIMENIGKASDQGNSHGTIHGPGYSGANGISATYTLPGGALFKDGYHTFAVNWQVNQLDFYVDDVLYASRTPASLPAGTTWVYNQPFFLLLNLAVGGGWPGNPDGTTVFPQQYRIDYIRVYHQGTPVPTATPTNTPTPVVASTWRVNAGGPAYTDGAGKLWSADTNYSGGTAATVTSTIAGTSDPTLYQTERYGNPFTYTFNVPAGSYQVTLKFAETYTGITAAGQRVFNVSINGSRVLSNFDIFAEVGANTADDKVFNNISPSGGTITIQLGPSSADNAKVDAIQIVPMPPTPTFTPTWTKTSTSTPTKTNTATFSWTSTATSTFTSTATRTNTFTATPTSTATASFTSTRTFTNTFSPTSTSTATFTNTSTQVFTATVTATRTYTSSSTSIATSSNSPAFTWTPTFSSTLSSTPALTATPTSTSANTLTSSSTSTYTSVATSTLTSTSTNTTVFTATHTSTATATATRTFTFSPTATLTMTSTPSNTFTLTSTGTATRTFTASGTATSSMTFTPTWSFTPTASATPTSSSTPSPTRTSTGTFTWTWTATPTWTFTPTSTKTRTATPTVTASLTPTQTPIPAPVLYPNPWDGGSPLSLGIALSPGSTVRLQLWTVAFRRIWSEQIVVPDTGNDRLVLDLPPMANGLYYLRVDSGGRHWTLKLLVLR